MAVDIPNDDGGIGRKKMMEKTMLFIGQGKLTQSFQTRGINIDPNRIGIWCYSSHASDVSHVANAAAGNNRHSMLKAVVTMGQIARGGYKRAAGQAPWFMMWCSEGPLTGGNRNAWGSKIGKLEESGISYTSFHWWNCVNGQYNKNEDEWYPQIQEYFAQTLGRPS